MAKPTLLLLPGLLNDERLWSGQTSVLSDTVRPLVADLTGAETISDLAANVLDMTPAEPFLLAGLSMGGYVALEVMRQAPERVIGLALLDTSARPDTPESTAGRRTLMEVAATDFPAVISKLLPKMLHPNHLGDESIAGTFTAMARSVGSAAFVSQQRAIMGRIDSRPSLGQIECPTLVLCGRDDAITPVEVHEELVAAIPGSHLTIVEDCGHLSALEQPERVAAALRFWIEGIPGA